MNESSMSAPCPARARRAPPGRRRVPAPSPSILALAMVAVLAVSVFAAPRAASADQRSTALPGLFEGLLDADDASIAARLESLIWQEWFVAPDDDARVLMSRLSAAMDARDLDTALERADELVELAPGFAEAWNRRATLHYLRGDDDLSVADIRETLALEPRHFGAVSGLGLIFLRQGDLEAALDAFEQVLEISPASSSARRSVEQVRRELDRAY